LRVIGEWGKADEERGKVRCRRLLGEITKRKGKKVNVKSRINH